MVVLNEYCVQHISKFLKPHDWVQMSQVCKLWKQATLKNWSRIAKITFLGYDYSKDTTIISAFDAGKIVLCAAPFVKVLETDFITNLKVMHRLNSIMIGAHVYRVENFKVKNILKLMIKKSTKLAEVSFDKTPEINLVRRLFKRNNIKKFKLNDPNLALYRGIPTHTIKEFDVNLWNATVDMVSFEGLFPNLKKLRLEFIYHREHEKPKNILKQIIPHVLQLKCLDLMIDSDVDCINKPSTDLSDVTLLSELEELKVSFLCSKTFQSLNVFLKQLATCCTKLRVLKLIGSTKINEETFLKILSLSQLEFLELEIGFLARELPEIKNLSELHISLNVTEQIFTEFVEECVKKMCRLKKLSIQFEISADKKRMLGHICAAVKAATSLGKDVLITHLHRAPYYKILRITTLSDFEESKIFDKSTRILELSFKFEEHQGMFEGVTKFVRNNLHRYNAFEFYDKKK